ncbi:hypothetical protein [Nostoc sp. ChiVER01]|uniref:hypothetical protein n=1 Tax=Nostoc sp. ChiVER01 TaxID=3075382 RepID=UPI002AD5098D|nr:hypothetical protein [Nostoc sp. ChiVER01]MDZ8225469.1 hypothetical protein [Nostoc sp. ChiVER01]
MSQRIRHPNYSVSKNTVLIHKKTRRDFLKYIKIGGLGVAGVTTTGLSLLQPTLAQFVNRQDDWRWCNKCQALAFAGNASLGACPAGGVHNHNGSYNYILIHDTPRLAGQDNWRWCNKCQVLAFAGNASLGACPAGGVHNHNGSYNYLLIFNTPLLPGQQDNWRWCNKCQVLAFAGNPSFGACPAGGVHDHNGSYNYTLEYL